MTRAQLETQVRKCCVNMIYIFIPDDTLKVMPAKYANRIYTKRQSQIDYLTGLTMTSGSSKDLSEIRSWIRDEIAKTYAPLFDPRTNSNVTATPELIIYHLSQGDEVNGINWIEGVFGIGKTVTNSFGTNGIIVNADGTFSQSGTQLSSNDTIYTWNKKGQLKTAAYFDGTNTYTAKYSKNKGWYAYSTANSNGDVFKVGSGTNLLTSDLTFWENINNILGGIKDILKELQDTFASWLSGQTSETLSPSQLADGWMEDPNDAGTDWATLLLVGAGALAAGTFIGGGKKSKSTSKNKEV